MKIPVLTTLLVFWSSTRVSHCSSNVVYANDFFANRLVKELRRDFPNQNLVCSPIALTQALAIVQFGSRAETRKEIEDLVSFPRCLKTIRNALHHAAANLVFGIKTRFYTNSEFEIEPNLYYKDRIETDHYAGIEEIFFHPRKETAFVVSEYVQKYTRDLIRDFVDFQAFTRNDTAFLIAVGHMPATQFADGYRFTGSSERAKFARTAGGPVNIPFIYQGYDCNYYESTKIDAKYIEIPLTNSYLFTLIIPNKESGLSRIIEASPSTLFDRPNYTKTKLNIYLPEFKVETRVSYKEIFQRLGAKRMFQGGNLNLIAENFRLQTIMQKSVISVNRNGINVEPSDDSSVKNKVDKNNKNIYVNRPFFFHLKHSYVLHAGVVEDPSAVPLSKLHD